MTHLLQKSGQGFDFNLGPQNTPITRRNLSAYGAAVVDLDGIVYPGGPILGADAGVATLREHEIDALLSTNKAIEQRQD